MYRFFLVFLLLQGCVASNLDNEFAEQKTNTRHELAQELLDHGVYFDQRGELTQIYIPSDKLFKPYTSQWSNGAHINIINDLVQLINSYDVDTVKVATAIYGAKSSRFINAIGVSIAQKFADAMLQSKLQVNVLNIDGVKVINTLPNKIKIQNKSRAWADYGFVKISFKYHHRFFS